MMDVVEFAGFVTLIGAILVAVVTWGLKEWSKRREENHRRKEGSYRILVESLKGLMVGGTTSQKQKFVDECRLSWLYCSDDVIRKENQLLRAMKYFKHPDNASKQLAADAGAGELMLAIRRDLIKGTGLGLGDFELFAVGRQDE